MSDFDYIPISRPSITEREKRYVCDAINTGWVSSIGEYIDRFEKEFAVFCDTKYAISTSNGTNALHLVLSALGIKRGDEVIIPDLTFVATANSVKYLGANVVCADIDIDTLCIDHRKIEKLINNKTKMIIPVHLYGHPAKMDEINHIANENNVFVVEDAAEAHGAEIKGKKVGGFGVAGVFSFYGNKIVTSGEGGMITTNDEKLFNRLKYLRDHAMSKEKRYWHTEVGYNYRMTNMQAALGLAQLHRIKELLEKKIKIFNWYEEELSDIEAITLNYQAKWAKSVYWMVCVQLTGYSENHRNSLIEKLNEKGIDSRPFFYPVSKMPMYKKSRTPVANTVYKKGINLPSYYDMKKKDVIKVCEQLKKIIK